jgi:glycosyltransferase involved in cell wall biosynthesis
MNRLPTKVLHVMNGAAGGAALSTLGLARELHRHGVRSCAVCSSAGSEQERESLREVCQGEVVFTQLYWWNRKTRGPLWKRPLSEIKQLWNTGWKRKSTRTVCDATRKFHADLIHTNTSLTPEGGLAAGQLRLPHVWHVRELMGPGQAFEFPISGERLGKFFQRRASRMVANSHASAALLKNYLPAEFLVTVPNGIPLEPFLSITPPPCEPKVVIGVVANLTSTVKQHDLVIAAAAQMSRELPVEWRFFGHDPSHGGTKRGFAYTDQLWDMIRQHQFADRFTFCGHVGNPAQIMRQLHILVHPTARESFGRIFVEAMAAGIPTIGANGGGAAEIIRPGETGLLFAPNDTRELAAAMTQLATDAAQRERLGAAGRAVAQREYSIAVHTSRMLDVYRAAMSIPLGTKHLQN